MPTFLTLSLLACKDGFNDSGLAEDPDFFFTPAMSNANISSEAPTPEDLATLPDVFHNSEIDVYVHFILTNFEAELIVEGEPKPFSNNPNIVHQFPYHAPNSEAFTESLPTYKTDIENILNKNVDSLEIRLSTPFIIGGASAIGDNVLWTQYGEPEGGALLEAFIPEAEISIPLNFVATDNNGDGVIDQKLIIVFDPENLYADIISFEDEDSNTQIIQTNLVFGGTIYAYVIEPES